MKFQLFFHLVNGSHVRLKRQPVVRQQIAVGKTVFRYSLILILLSQLIFAAHQQHTNRLRRDTPSQNATSSASAIAGTNRVIAPVTTSPVDDGVTEYITIPAGSYIVDMGQATQTVANGLKPYGLVYDLIVNARIPVDWAINPSKSKDGYDFSTYRGGPFIIRAPFVSPVVTSIINAWKAKGVIVVGPIASGISAVPVYETLTSFPRIVLDSATGAIAANYLVNAEIPATAYTTKSAALLNMCDDYYVMPHADPTWATHSNLRNFNNLGGGIWGACHMVSVMENVDDPGDADTAPNLNFLSQTGMVNFTSHSAGSPPYSYAVAPPLGSDPVMQFLGILDSATQNGSEQIYLPRSGGGWRPSTKIYVWDPTQTNVPGSSPGPATVLAFGRGFGNISNGYVMYEGGHNHAKATAPANIAAQRAFFNAILLTGIERRIEATISGLPTTINEGATVSLSAAPTSGSGSYIYQWVSSCGGTFSNPNSATTNFTTPAITADTACYIRPLITDTCGRKAVPKTASGITIINFPDVDYGDAPDTGAGTGAGNYQTTLADNGARHTIVAANPRLGASADSDNGAAQNVTALADDTTGADDEDGTVSVPSIITSDTSYSIRVNATNPASVDAFIYAWVDFNKNGVFEPTEAKSAKINNGDSNKNFDLNWTGLSGLTAGTTYARIRISTDPLLTTSMPNGQLSNGEVEDYQVAIIASGVPNVLGFKSVVMTTDADSSGSVTPGDTLTWTVQYINNGTVDATTFQMNDLLPAGLTITSPGAQTITRSGGSASKNASYTGATAGAASNLLTSGTLARDGWIKATIPVIVGAGVSGVRANQASATGTGISGAVLTDNAGQTSDLPPSVTGNPFNVTIVSGAVLQTITPSVDPTTVNIVQPVFSVSGKVWNDTTPNAIINAGEPGTNAGSPLLTVYAVNGSGITIGKALVDASTGNYTISNLVNGSYVLRLSNDETGVPGFPAPTSASLPVSWYNSGENLNGTTETVTPGEIALTIAGANIVNYNFGIYVPPPVIVGFQSVKLTTDADNSGTVTPGDRLTLTAQYVNTGMGDASNFQIKETLPAGLTPTGVLAHTVTPSGAGTNGIPAGAYTGTGTGIESELLEPNATLASGGVIRVDIPVSVGAGSAGSKSIQASATATEISTPVLTDNAGQTADLPATITASPYNVIIPADSISQTITPAIDPVKTTVVSAPVVMAYKSVRLTADPDNSGGPTPGDALMWTVQYKNSGTVDVIGFQINDLLPAGVTIAATGAQVVTVTGTTVASPNTGYTGAALGAVSNLLAGTATFKAGDVIKIDIPITVTAGVSGILNNQAVGTATNLPLAGVRTDNADNTTGGLPAGVVIPAASLAQFQGAGTDPTSVVIGIPPSVFAFKSVKLTTDSDSSGDITEGDIVTWTVQYKNASTVDVTNFQIHDVLPEGVSITAAGAQTIVVTGTTSALVNSNYTGIDTDTELMAAVTTFKPGDVIKTDVPVYVNYGTVGTISNQATGTASNLLPIGVKTDNVDHTTAGLPSGIIIPGNSVLQTQGAGADPTSFFTGTAPNILAFKSVKLITDADSSGSITPGDALIYTLQYVNTGAGAATSFQINDLLPGGLVMTTAGNQTVAASGAGTSAIKNTAYTGTAAGISSELLTAGGTLASGGVIRVDIPVTISPGATGIRLNQAVATAAGLSGPAVTDNAGQTSDLPATVTGDPYNLTIPPGSISQIQNPTTDPTVLTIAGIPAVTLVKTCPDPADCTTAPQAPGTELVYNIVFTNTGTEIAQQLIVLDVVPDNTDFKVASESVVVGTTGLTFLVEFSNDYTAASPGSATWTYTPTSGGGGAPAGYDRNVKAVRWRVTAGNLGYISPGNTGDVSFTVRIR